MSYVINLCELRDMCDISNSDLNSEMIEVVKKKERLLLEYGEFVSFLENEFETTDINEIIDKYNISFVDIMDRFEMSDLYYEFMDNFEPMICYIHITQYRPSSKELELLEEHCPAVVWIELEGVFQGIGLTGAGMDFSDSLELAYYIIDRESPIRATQRLSLSERNWDILLKMREAVDNREYLNLEKLLKGEE